MSRTWLDIAYAAGARTEEEADLLLWAGTCFPFGTPRMVWYQLRHSVRHKICVDHPSAMCAAPALSK